MASDMALLEKNEAIVERKLDNVQHELDEILQDAEAEFTEEEVFFNFAIYIIRVYKGGNFILILMLRTQ